MANNYGVVDPGKEWSPGQEKVDLILNRIDGCPDKDDLDYLIAMGQEKAQQYIEERFAELRVEVEQYLDAIIAKIEARLKPLEPLVPKEIPGDLMAVIEYIKALIAYFNEPYTALIEASVFYSQFSMAVATALTAKAAKMPTSLPDIPVPDVPVPDIPVPDVPVPDIPVPDVPTV